MRLSREIARRLPGSLDLVRSRVPRLQRRDFFGVCGAVWRGVKNKDLRKDFPEGKTNVWWWAFSSTTKKVSTLQNPMFLGEEGTRTQFMIEQLNGIDIVAFSMYPEAEILLFPGTKLEVVDHTELGHGLVQIHLREVAVDAALIS